MSRVAPRTATPKGPRGVGIGPRPKCKSCTRPLAPVTRDTWIGHNRVKGDVVGYGYVDRGVPNGHFCSLRCGFRWAIAQVAS